jgi:pimeloyl-ACP methyl ester carboxylesterase
MLRLVSSFALSLAIGLGAIAAHADTPPPAGFVRPPPPGQLVDIGGRRLHILCKGDAKGPTVIFEAGLSQYTANTTYGKAQDAIAPFARVCTYDRAGMGWSDPDPQPRTYPVMVQDLHRLLAAAKVPGPYVLVGHSMGGPLVRLYATTWPKEVAGVVLVDATAEATFPEVAATSAPIAAQIDAAVRGARPGQPIIGMPAGTPDETTMTFTPEILLAVKAEFEAFDHLPAAMKAPGGFGRLGATPLVVIRRGKDAADPPNATDLAWRAAQEQLATISTNSVLIVARNSGHTIPLDEPQVVAGGVRRVLDAGRSGAKLTQLAGD